MRNIVVFAFGFLVLVARFSPGVPKAENNPIDLLVIVRTNKLSQISEVFGKHQTKRLVKRQSNGRQIKVRKPILSLHSQNKLLNRKS